MVVWVLPSDALLQVAEDSVGLQSEFPSSKLVRLELKLVPKPLGLDRLFEFHLDEFALGPSGILPRVEAIPSDGALLSTLGLRLSTPITDKLPWAVVERPVVLVAPPNNGRLSSRMDE